MPTEKSLRKKLIRLAYEKPELRGDILPLVAKSARSSFRPGDEVVEPEGDTGVVFRPPSNAPSWGKGRKDMVWVHWDSGVQTWADVNDLDYR
jgi:hypothetical protein